MEPYIKYFRISFLRIISDLTISIILLRSADRWKIWPYDFAIFYAFSALISINAYIILKKEYKLKEEMEQSEKDNKKDLEIHMDMDNKDPISNDPMI
jgi:hypothetical protein